jgi:hypothetical protein
VINTARSEYPIIDEVARDVLGWRVSKDPDSSKDFDLWWSDLGIDSNFLAGLKSYQKVNHFPAMYQITRKTYLARNLKKMQKLFPDDFDFFPRSWCLPSEMSELARAQSLAYNKLTDHPRVRKQPNRLPAGFPMIVKPDCQSQGKGIFLTTEMEKISPTDVSIVQEYINDPLLINGLKFDMRVYVLVTSCDPLTIYVNREGLVRFATQ